MMKLKLIYDKKAIQSIPGNASDMGYDESLDNHLSVLADICDRLEETKQIQFHVSGFGMDAWRVDCAFDLLSIIDTVFELTPKLAVDVDEIQLDFDEQGTEKTIQAKLDGNQYDLICLSLLGDLVGIPERIEKEAFIEMLTQFTQDFATLAGMICPELWNQSLLQNWLQKISFNH